jgi:hypothetical protein
MRGIKYLLDKNCIPGLLKATSEVLDLVPQRTLLASECAYSAITRMELLGFPGSGWELSGAATEFFHAIPCAHSG